MSHSTNAPRRLLFALTFVLMLTLAGLSLLSQAAQANFQQDEDVFLPLVQPRSDGATIPPRP